MTHSHDSKNLADMTPEEREPHIAYPPAVGCRGMNIDLLAALRDADRTRECPTCGGKGEEHYGIGEEGESYSGTCLVSNGGCGGTGRITREKWALLKVAAWVEAPGVGHDCTWGEMADEIRNFDPEVTPDEQT